MNDTTFIEKVSQWLDGELSQAEVAELQAYLAAHPEHDQTYQAIRRADNLLRAASTVMLEPQPGFTSRFETRLAHHRLHRTWQVWLGLSTLLLSTFIILTLMLVVGGLTALSAWADLLNMQIFYYWLGLLGQTINEGRSFINLLGVVLKIARIVLSQPLFWLLLPLAGGLGWLWLRLLKTPPQRLLTSGHMLV